MQRYLIKNINLVNEGEIKHTDVLIENEHINRIDKQISVGNKLVREINGEGLFLMPGCIDDQVHFREPGFTHKATIYSESKAAIAGGVTSFMEMPNTNPPVFTQQLLEEKYAIAAQTSLANFSFYMGTHNNTVDEALRTNEKLKTVCGLKIFMGSSTGNLLVDDSKTIEKLFSQSGALIAVHCEDEKLIKNNLQKFLASGKIFTINDYSLIRNDDACYSSSNYAVNLAKKYNTRLHVLHISTEKELSLFNKHQSVVEKKITAEVCVHHLHYSASNLDDYGNLLKCNPAIKEEKNKTALWEALLNNTLDVISTDHAPHTLAEKYFIRNIENKLIPILTDKPMSAAAGLPGIQHSLRLMLYYYLQNKISLEQIVYKMCHNVADCFSIFNRGYVREGYYADLVVFDPNKSSAITSKNIMYKCGWSPLEKEFDENHELAGKILFTFVNGNLAFENDQFNELKQGKRILFNR